MKISELSIKRSVTTTMLVLLVILLGIISLGRISLDLFPNLNFPMAAVITNYSGVGPNEIETMVTRPLENALATSTNITSISSTSGVGQSLILLEFNWGTNMDFATLDMREKIDLIEGFFPDEVDKPLVVTFDPSIMPILQIGITGDEDQIGLKDTVEDKIIPRLERLEGVASVGLAGGLTREILIELDQTKLTNYGITLTNIAQTLMLENMSLSGGRVSRGQNEYLIRTKGKFETVDEIKKVMIPTTNGLVALEEFAQVKDTFKEVFSEARMNGKPSIGLTIQKQTVANTVQVSNQVKAELEKIKSDLGDGYEIEYLMDQSSFIERAIGNVWRNAILGGILAIVVLFVFLRNVRSTFIIATAIPISIITTFSLIYFGGLTINMMTLGGLALGVGMLVDNAIVVLENIYRHRRLGLNRIEAASVGSQQVGMAIVASTLTTAIVFLPVVFVEGLASQLFKELALTITFSLIASLLVALTFIPMISSKILKVSKKEKNKSGKFNGIFNQILQGYQKSLSWSISHRWVIILLLIIAFLGSLMLFPFIGADFIPNMDQGEFTITVNLPIGTILEQTDQIVTDIEQVVQKIPEVSMVFTRVGSAGDMFNSVDSSMGSIMVRLNDLKDRTRSTAEVMEELRQSLRYPDTEIAIESMNSMGGAAFGGAPISIKVKGNDLQKLEELSLQIRKLMAEVNGVREIDDSISDGHPELEIKIDRSQAAKLGLRVSQIATLIKTAIQGEIVTRYEVDGQEVDVRVRLKEADRTGLSKVENLQISSPLGAKISLHQIADFSFNQTPREIRREDQVRMVEITADIFGVDLQSVMAEIEAKINENIDLPDQYEIIYGGEFAEMVDSFKSLFFALILAVVLVYMVLASQFESLLHPFIIMFTVPMGAIGVLVGLFITGHNLSVPGLIGVIMLAGIVVNNAIVLVDYINNRRRAGYSVHEAILEAAPIRVRPILMTALTTILGLMPLAMGIGDGAEVQAPMAIVVIGGLSCATILTLYVVPVLYSLAESMSNWTKSLFKISKKSAEVVSPES